MRCLEDEDDDVVYAAVQALITKRDLAAAEALLGLLGTGRVNDKRLVAMLEYFPLPIHTLLWPRLEDPDPRVRTWAATLLEVSGEDETVIRLIEAARAPDADVRSAAIKRLTNIGAARTEELLPETLDDGAWFGRSGASGGEPEGDQVLRAGHRPLTGRDLVVRQNAKTALIVVFAVLENTLRVRQQRHEDFRAMALSRHTLPVSVVIPGYNEEGTMGNCLHSLAKLDYPQYEIIAVNDGSKDRTLEVLIEELVRVDVFSRRHFDTAEVRAVYRSTIYEEFYVIDKANGGKADSLNCGINFSRYPYLCTADADTIFAPDSLLKGMRVILRDPQRAVAVGSLIGINNGCTVEKGVIKSFGLPKKPLVVLQWTEYLRSFLLNRLAWTRLNFMMVVSGAFAIYRRDVLVELGGFSKAFTCEDIEMTFRIHEHMRRTGRPYRILSLPEAVSWTEAPDKRKDLYRQRHRWQRVICETFWAYKGMTLNPRYGTVGMIGMPYYLVGEVLPWVPELLALVMIPCAIYLGVFAWWPLIVFLGIFVLSNVLISVMGLLQDVGFRSLSQPEMVRLILMNFIESFGYRHLLSFARFAGTIGFLRGEKGWQKFVRVERKEILPPERESFSEPGATDARVYSSRDR